MQFLDTATLLQIHTIRQCAKFPKKYTFYVTQDIAKLANSILDHVKEANSLYPTNLHEVQMRRDHLLNAYTQAQAMITKINNAQEFFPISGGAMTDWMELIGTEMKLLQGVMKSDKQRYKRFNPKGDSSAEDTKTNEETDNQ